jgi:hypothetical protein
LELSQGAIRTFVFLPLLPWAPFASAQQCTMVDPCALTFNGATGQSPPSQPLTINVPDGVYYTASVTVTKTEPVYFSGCTRAVGRETPVRSSGALESRPAEPFSLSGLDH